MSLLTRLRRFVDWDFGTSNTVGGNASLLVLGLVWLLAVFAMGSGGPRIWTVSLVLAAIFSLAWLMFVLWRGWRLFRASAIKGDRAYDQKGKAKLPPEYRDTESVTKASRSKRQ